MPARCINIDWLEVYCLEPSQPRDAEYFRDRGYVVHERGYGTRVYSEMFTIDGTDGFHLLEVRRAPCSTVLEPYACHVRLCNRTCYYDDAVTQLRDFLRIHGYTLSRIARIDIALDFERFDSGDLPIDFIRRYMRGKYSKINQSNITAHGRDTWSAREWNSLSWGSLNSAIGTKFYCKTRELEEVADKPYIRQAWFLCGLIDNLADNTKIGSDGQPYRPNIYRLEFSIRSSVRGWFQIEADGKAKNIRSIRNTLEMYDSREKLLAMFASLCRHYFHFRHYVEGRNKYKCDEKVLFNFGTEECYYQVERLASPSKPDRELASLLSKLRNFRNAHTENELRRAAATLIKYLEDEDLIRCTSKPFRSSELYALREALAMRLQGSTKDPAQLMAELRNFVEQADMFL